MRIIRLSYLGVVILLLAASLQAGVNRSGEIGSSESQANQQSDLATELGVKFVQGSSTKLIIEREGKRYEVDLALRQIRQLSEPAAKLQPAKLQVSNNTASSSSSSAQSNESSAPAHRYYRPGDDLLFTLPTGRPVEKHAWIINFTHRFPYEAAFTERARGATLLGLDDFAIPSFGIQYGVTGRLSVSAYRSPTDIGRPIELGAKYRLLDERHEVINLTGRFSVDGQNNFQRNFTTNFELIGSRSLGHRAQLYAVPTFSVHNRPVLAAQTSLINPPPYQPCSQGLATNVPASFNVRPCANTFSVGFGAAVDVRPSVALVAEVIPTFVNETDLGIHRMPFSFGIQKKLFHHAFTFGFTTAPGTNTSQRIATRSIFLLEPQSDTPSGMFVGFDLMRQLP